MTGEQLAKQVASVIATGQEVPASVKEKAAVPEAQNSCEGADCINYDFPFDFTPRGDHT